MHRLIIALVIVGGSAGLAHATDVSSFFPERVKDFGNVPRGPALEHSFVLRNTSSRTVRISDIRVSCGCVTATALETSVAPGQQTAIAARMDTTRFDGVKSVTIYVKFSRPWREEASLSIRANNHNELLIKPETLAFGQVRRGSTPSESTRITFVGDASARIVKAVCDSNYVTPTVRELSRQGTEVTYELQTELRADAPVGKWFTDVWVTTTSSATPRLRVPLTVEVESALNVSPSTVEMGQVKAGEAIERKVIVRGVKPFKVMGVRGADDTVTVRDSTRSSNQIHVLTIRLQSKRTGAVKQVLSFVTDLKGDSEIQAVLTATVVP